MDLFESIVSIQNKESAIVEGMKVTVDQNLIENVYASIQPVAVITPYLETIGITKKDKVFNIYTKHTPAVDQKIKSECSVVVHESGNYKVMGVDNRFQEEYVKLITIQL